MYQNTPKNIMFQNMILKIYFRYDIKLHKIIGTSKQLKMLKIMIIDVLMNHNLYCTMYIQIFRHIHLGYT